MSGQRRIIVSSMQGKSESAITSALMDQNEVAAKIQGKGDAKKEQKKEKKTGK